MKGTGAFPRAAGRRVGSRVAAGSAAAPARPPRGPYTHAQGVVLCYKIFACKIIDFWAY